MNSRPNFRSLLKQSETLMSAPGNLLLEEAMDILNADFRNVLSRSGAWMAIALQSLGLETPRISCSSYMRLFVFKYALATLSACAYITGCLFFQTPVLIPGALFIFYAVEVQFVFLFPVIACGSDKPLWDSLALTRRAGGTWQAMRIVLPTAALMVFGALGPRVAELARAARMEGTRPWFARVLYVWCQGCLIIAIWYQELCRSES